MSAAETASVATLVDRHRVTSAACRLKGGASANGLRDVRATLRANGHAELAIALFAEHVALMAVSQGCATADTRCRLRIARATIRAALARAAVDAPS